MGRSRAEKRSISLESARFLVALASPRSSSRRSRSTIFARRIRAAPHPCVSRPSMALNFRASSTRLHDADVRNILHYGDDVNDVNSDVQVPVTLLQMSPLDDDVDIVPWSLQRASATRCALHAAVDAPTAASVVDAMRGGG